MDKTAIQEIAQAQAVTASGTEIGNGMASRKGAVALPNDFTLHDLEKYLPNRRRIRGHMHTSVIADFAVYAAENKEEGAAVFIDPKTMSATAVLNLGTPASPGHCDNTAELSPERTAAYKAIRAIAGNGAVNQTVSAEFLEDWTDIIKCFKDGEQVPNNKAIAAVRSITIEALRKVAVEEQQLSASRSAFEKISASSDTAPIPTEIRFTCVPYKDLPERTFVMRLGILTSEKPTLTLRIIKIEEHEEQMAGELAGLIAEAIKTDMPVLIGKYSAAR